MDRIIYEGHLCDCWNRESSFLFSRNFFIFIKNSFYDTIRNVIRPYN